MPHTEKTDDEVKFSDDSNLIALNFQNINLKEGKGKMSLIEIFITQKYKNKNAKKVIIEKIKERIFEPLKEENIISSYKKIVLSIAKHFNLDTESIAKKLESKRTNNEEQPSESITKSEPTTQEDAKETNNEVSESTEKAIP